MARKAIGTAADYTKYEAARASDATAGAAGMTVEYAKQAAAKARDATLSTSEAAAEYAKRRGRQGRDGEPLALSPAQEAPILLLPPPPSLKLATPRPPPSTVLPYAGDPCPPPPSRQRLPALLHGFVPCSSVFSLQRVEFGDFFSRDFSVEMW